MAGGLVIGYSERALPLQKMFNFLVTAADGAWDRPGYEYDRVRFLEYTSEEIAESFRELKDEQLAALTELPCLFAYEGTDEPMRVGRLKSVRLRGNGRSLLVVPEINTAISPIPFDAIEPLQALLDIRGWELNRTHWAIKDEDLLEVLANAGIDLNEVSASKVSKADLPKPADAPFQAGSVGAFIDHVLALNRGGLEVFYRGHSNRTKYRLEPSILRKDHREIMFTAKQRTSFTESSWCRIQLTSKATSTRSTGWYACSIIRCRRVCWTSHRTR